MKWPEFLAAISDAEQISFVGPLLGRQHTPHGPTIYIDGGSDFRSSTLCDFPIVSIGDGDSVSGRLDEFLPTEKDFSDLAFVLAHIPQNATRLEMHGFLGGRRDHEYANLGEVHRFLCERAHFTQVEFFNDDVVQIAACCKGRMSLEIHGLFSVFVIEPTQLTISGACRYALRRDKALLPLSSHGLSNQGSGIVEIESGYPAFVFIN